MRAEYDQRSLRAGHAIRPRQRRSSIRDETATRCKPAGQRAILVELVFAGDPLCFCGSQVTKCYVSVRFRLLRFSFQYFALVGPCYSQYEYPE